MGLSTNAFQRSPRTPLFSSQASCSRARDTWFSGLESDSNGPGGAIGLGTGDWGPPPAAPVPIAASVADPMKSLPPSPPPAYLFSLYYSEYRPLFFRRNDYGSNFAVSGLSAKNRSSVCGRRHPPALRGASVPVVGASCPTQTAGAGGLAEPGKSEWDFLRTCCGDSRSILRKQPTGRENIRSLSGE